MPETCLGQAWGVLLVPGVLSCFCAVSHIMSCPALFLLCFALLSGLVPVLTYFVFSVSLFLILCLLPRERWGGQRGVGQGPGHICVM